MSRVMESEIETHRRHMSHFQFQRWVFRKAEEVGWNCKEPSVLGGYESEKSFDAALRFICGDDGNAQTKPMREFSKENSDGSDIP